MKKAYIVFQIIKIIAFNIIFFMFSCNSGKDKKNLNENDSTINSHVENLTNKNLDKDSLEQGNVYCEAYINLGKKFIYRVDSLNYQINVTSIPKNKIEASYNISLTDSNGNKLFNKNIDKNLFKDIIKKNYKFKNDFSLNCLFTPVYITFNRLSQEIYFDCFLCDNKGYTFNCYLSLDINGNIKFIKLGDFGWGCKSELFLLKGGKFFVTCQGLFDQNGKEIRNGFDANDYTISTLKINDNAFLVIKDTTVLNNAKILDSKGNLLNEFNFKGCYNNEGYVTFIDKTEKYLVLFDHINLNLILVNIETPSDIAFRPLRQLKEITYKPNKDNSSLIVEYNTLLSGQSRYNYIFQIKGETVSYYKY